MGSGASAGASTPTLPWPEGATVVLRPDGVLPDGLKTSGPVPSTESGVPFWRLGGAGKGRLRVIEDTAGLLELKENFTIAVCFRPGAGDAQGWDSLLLGHDNKHWLAMPGDDKTKVCCMDGDSSLNLNADFLDQGWIQIFLRSVEGGTSVFGMDQEGLLDLGTFPTSLVGSKLRNAGWATNEVDIAAIAFWDRILTWAELSPPALAPAPAPPPDPDAPIPKRIFGQVTDLAGEPLKDVSIKWKMGGCISDGEGSFAMLEEAETDVPEDGSQASASSTSSCVSFECDGFAPTSMRISVASEQSIVVALRKLSATATLDATEGGQVVDPSSGSSVTVPPSSLVYADGSPVTGPVTVSLSIIDATDPASLASMPGDFSAIGADGESVMLESLGAAWIGAVDSKGEALEVKEDSEGVTLDIHTTVQAKNAAKLEVLPEMWSFDEETGKWQLAASDMAIDGQAAPNASRVTVREETAVEEELPKARPRKSKRAYRKPFDPEKVAKTWMTPEAFREKLAQEGEKSIAAPVSKLGYWNIDMAYHSPNRAVMFKGRVLDRAGDPLADAQIWGVGKSYHGRSPDTTDKGGRFEALVVQFDSEVDVEVSYRKPADSDKKLDVFFQGGYAPRVSSVTVEKLLAQLPGSYHLDETKEYPRWWKSAPQGVGPSCSIRWSSLRHRWHLMVGERVLFGFPGDEDGQRGSPVGDGWQPTRDLATESLTVLKCHRARKVISEKFGPYHTGPAGNFVDLGEFKTGA